MGKENSADRNKKFIESEKDPLILQALLVQASAEIERLRAENERLQKEEAKARQATFNFEEQARLLRRALFGRSREERTEASDRPRDKSQTDALVFSQAAYPAPETRDPSDKNKTKGKGLDEVVVEHRMSEEELADESRLRGLGVPSASQWSETGLFDQSVKINIIERRYVREIHRRMKYKLVANVESEKEVIVTANLSPELLPGMNYTTEFITAIVADKYISHMPLESQTREMESLGLKTMKTSTLSRLCGLAAVSLESMAEKIKDEVIAADVALHGDETPWKIQKKDEQDGYMWVMSNRFGSYYFYRPTRSGRILREILANRQGPILTDGFSGYNILEEIGIKHAYCWAHARREFLPLESHDPSVKPILNDIDELFAIDREAKTFGELEGLRLRRSSVVVARLYQRLLDEYPRSRDGSQKRKAIDYLLKRWVGFNLFIGDTRIPLSNNEAERTIRHAVMGRKNYYGSGNHAGAETAAILFTVIESCKKNDIDPRTFLQMGLQAAARGEELETPLSYARRTRQHA